MANIIRIRKLEEEKNLNNIIFPVDKDSYGSNARRISIFDLKTWILSGFTGGGNTSCTGITSNIITVIVTGSTTTTTSTTTSTTTTTMSPTISEIYFNTNALGNLAVNNPLGRIFNITLKYELEAYCNNFYTTPDQQSNEYPGSYAMTIFEISNNNGSTWTPISNVSAIVNPGFSTGEDINTISGTTSFSTAGHLVTDFKVRGTMNCYDSYEVTSGDVKITIISVTTAAPGQVTKICNDIWNMDCSIGNISTSVSCTTPPPLSSVFISNMSLNTYVSSIIINGISVIGATMPINPGQTTTGTTYQGHVTVAVAISSHITTSNISIIDGSGITSVQTVVANNTYTFNNIIINSSPLVIIIGESSPTTTTTTTPTPTYYRLSRCDNASSYETGPYPSGTYNYGYRLEGATSIYYQVTGVNTTSYGYTNIATTWTTLYGCP